MSKQLFEQQKEIESTKEILWDIHEKKEIKPLEFINELSPDLFGIEPKKAQEMVLGLTTTIAEREVLKNAYIDVIELPITSENLPIFKELRLKIVKNRTQGIEKWHTTNKAFYLAGGRFVDAIKNKEILENQQMEEKLLEAEKFFENQEKEKLRILKEERGNLILPYVDFIPDGLEALDEEMFDSFLMGAKSKFEAKKEAEKLEAERIENERIEREKAIESQRLENERLKKEAEEKEAQLQKERAESESKQKAIQEAADKKASEEKAKHDDILKAEQEAKAKIESELKAKKDAEQKAENERIEKEKAEKLEAEKLAKAPVKKQLSIWVNSFELPSSTVDNEISKEIKEKFEAFKKWSLTQINNL